MASRNWNAGQHTEHESDVDSVGSTPKKTTVGARERDEAARRDWQEQAQTMPAKQVVVIDESGTHLDMLRRYGRAPRGKRVYVKQRRNYGKNMTLLSGLTLNGMTESLV